MEFSKYEATANDFIMLDRMSEGPRATAEDAVRLCERRTGIGADGIIELLPSAACDLRMRILNADGSEAEMCGNGLRALHLFALDQGVLDKDEVSVETLAGPRAVKRIAGPQGSQAFTVNMGKPETLRSKIPVTGPGNESAVGVEIPLSGGAVTATCVSMGNPHCVIFVDDIDECLVESIGPRIETHEMFPERTNVEFVHVASGGVLEARVWERGVGETMACGTGACAALVAASLNGLCSKRASVVMPGGRLELDWTEDGVLMTGPARHVFDGKTVD
jgi:diaminopimelate epimerase